MQLSQPGRGLVPPTSAECGGDEPRPKSGLTGGRKRRARALEEGWPRSVPPTVIPALCLACPAPARTPGIAHP